MKDTPGGKALRRNSVWSRVGIGDAYANSHGILKQLMVYITAWLATQKAETRAKGATVQLIVHDEAQLKDIRLTVRVLIAGSEGTPPRQRHTRCHTWRAAWTMLKLDVLYRNRSMALMSPCAARCKTSS